MNTHITNLLSLLLNRNKRQKLIAKNVTNVQRWRSAWENSVHIYIQLYCDASFPPQHVMYQFLHSYVKKILFLPQVPCGQNVHMQEWYLFFALPYMSGK